MFFSKLDAMSVGTMWILRSQEQPQFARHQHDCPEMDCCPMCGELWIQTHVEHGSILPVFATPLTNEAQQKLVGQCLTAAGWNAHSAGFSLHASCLSNCETALLALQEYIARYSPELVLVFGSDAAQLLHADFIPGQIHLFENTPLIATHHPEEMINNPALKAQVWADLCLAK